MRVFTLVMLGALAVAGAGCTSGVKSSDGEATFTYDCSGIGKGWGDCTEKADAQCGARNYTVVSRKGSAEGKDAGGNTEMTRTMVVSCKHQQ